MRFPEFLMQIKLGEAQVLTSFWLILFSQDGLLEDRDCLVCWYGFNIQSSIWLRVLNTYRLSE